MPASLTFDPDCNEEEAFRSYSQGSCGRTDILSRNVL